MWYQLPIILLFAPCPSLPLLHVISKPSIFSNRFLPDIPLFRHTASTIILSPAAHNKFNFLIYAKCTSVISIKILIKLILSHPLHLEMEYKLFVLRLLSNHAICHDIVICLHLFGGNTDSIPENCPDTDFGTSGTVLHRRGRRGTWLVGLCYRSFAASIWRVEGQSCSGSCLGSLPLYCVAASSPLGGVDCLVDTRHSGIARDHGVALQQYR